MIYKSKFRFFLILSIYFKGGLYNLNKEKGKEESFSWEEEKLRRGRDERECVRFAKKLFDLGK